MVHNANTLNIDESSKALDNLLKDVVKPIVEAGFDSKVNGNDNFKAGQEALQKTKLIGQKIDALETILDELPDKMSDDLKKIPDQLSMVLDDPIKEIKNAGDVNRDCVIRELQTQISLHQQRQRICLTQVTTKMQRQISLLRNDQNIALMNIADMLQNLQAKVLHQTWLLCSLIILIICSLLGGIAFLFFRRATFVLLS